MTCIYGDLQVKSISMAVRCITNVGMLEYTLPLFPKLHMLPVEYMYNFLRRTGYVAVAILPQITFNPF